MLIKAIVIFAIVSCTLTAIGVAMAIVSLIRNNRYTRKVNPPERHGLF